VECWSARSSLLLAGLAVPALGETVGWRASFLLAVAFPVSGILLLLPFRPAAAGPVVPPSDGARRRRSRHPALWLAGAGMRFGSMLPGVVLAFMVPSTVDAGLSPGVAGLWFALLNVISAVSRAGVALLADGPVFRGNTAVTTMMVLGGLGSGLVAIPSLATVLAGAVFAFSMGWWWTGQAFALALRTFTENPGAVASMMQSGGMASSALGPFLGAAVVHLWACRPPGSWPPSRPSSVDSSCMRCPRRPPRT
jgi:cyanate permease